MTKEQFLAALKYAADYVVFNSLGYPEDYGGGFGCHYDKLLNDAYFAKYGVRLEMWNTRFCYRIVTKAKHTERPLILGGTIYRDYYTCDTYTFALSCGSAYETAYLASMDRTAVAGETAITMISGNGKTGHVIQYADIAGVDTAVMQYSILPGGFPPLGYRMHYPGKHYGFTDATPTAGIDLTNALKLVGQCVML